MIEWLTTGQMIDRLKVGQEAKSNNRYDLHIIKTSQGIEHVNTCDGKYLRMNIPSPETLLWRIQPVQVTLEEAMKALDEGKKIWCEYNGKKDWFSKVLDFSQREVAPSFDEILYGKWTIEGD